MYESNVVKPRELAALLPFMIEQREPLMIWGSPESARARLYMRRWRGISIASRPFLRCCMILRFSRDSVCRIETRELWNFCRPIL